MSVLIIAEPTTGAVKPATLTTVGNQLYTGERSLPIVPKRR